VEFIGIPPPSSSWVCCKPSSCGQTKAKERRPRNKSSGSTTRLETPPFAAGALSLP
jgi:hypothetical protein